MSPFRRRAALKRRRLLVGCLFAVSLSAVSGLTDAIGFLLVGDFLAFMSGNTTRLSIALAHGDVGHALRLVAILAAFVLGNASGVVLTRFFGRRQVVVLTAVSGFTALGAATALYPPAILSVAFAMGMINVALEEVSGHPLGVTYVTGALSRLGRGLGHLVTGNAHPGWWLQAVPWVGLFAGTICGALIERRLGVSALFVSAGLSAALGITSLLIPPRWRRSFFARRSPPRIAPRRRGPPDAESGQASGPAIEGGVREV